MVCCQDVIALAHNSKVKESHGRHVEDVSFGCHKTSSLVKPKPELPKSACTGSEGEYLHGHVAVPCLFECEKDQHVSCAEVIHGARATCSTAAWSYGDAVSWVVSAPMHGRGEEREAWFHCRKNHLFMVEVL